MSEVNAKKECIGAAQAIKLARQAKKLFSTRGKKVLVADLARGKPDEVEIRKLILGLSGNLRAPVIRVGSTMVVGFHEQTWAELLL